MASGTLAATAPQARTTRHGFTGIVRYSRARGNDGPDDAGRIALIRHSREIANP